MIFLPIYSPKSFVLASQSTSETDWKEICLLVQQVLYRSCNAYVDDDGDLTAEGERAFGCIRNGAILAAGAGYLQPWLIPFLGKGLDFLDDLT